jgi:hypothetical protein
MQQASVWSICFLRFNYGKKGGFDKPRAEGPKKKGREPKAKRHDGICHGLEVHHVDDPTPEPLSVKGAFSQ